MFYPSTWRARSATIYCCRSNSTLLALDIETILLRLRFVPFPGKLVSKFSLFELVLGSQNLQFRIRAEVVSLAAALDFPLRRLFIDFCLSVHSLKLPHLLVGLQLCPSQVVAKLLQGRPLLQQFRPQIGAVDDYDDLSLEYAVSGMYLEVDRTDGRAIEGWTQSSTTTPLAVTVLTKSPRSVTSVIIEGVIRFSFPSSCRVF